MVYKLFDKKSALGSGVANNQRKNYTNQLIETLRKEQFIHNLKKIFGVLIYDIFNKYAWVFPLRDKKGVSTVNAS